MDDKNRQGEEVHFYVLRHVAMAKLKVEESRGESSNKPDMSVSSGWAVLPVIDFIDTITLNDRPVLESTKGYVELDAHGKLNQVVNEYAYVCVRDGRAVKEDRVVGDNLTHRPKVWYEVREHE